MQVLANLAEYYDKTLTANQLQMYAHDLKLLEIHEIEKAALLYRSDAANNFFPLPAKLISLIEKDDGRPGTEEAWMLAPKNENSSAYVNNEIMSSWAIAAGILKETKDHIAARMAFKESYEKTVRENRVNKIKPNWWLSRGGGYDRESADKRAIQHALEQKRILIDDAKKYLELENKLENDKIKNTIQKSLQKL